MGRWRNPNGDAPKWYLDRIRANYAEIHKKGKTQMAKLTIIEPPPNPVPPKRFIVELDETELGTIMALLGASTHSSRGLQYRSVTDQLYRTFSKTDLFYTPFYREPLDSLRRGNLPLFD